MITIRKKSFNFVPQIKKPRALKIKKILVSQPQTTNSKDKYETLARKYGVEIVYRPFIQVERISTKEFRKQKINFSDFDAVILTSRTAADHFFGMAEATRTSISPDMRYYCLSESIAYYLTKYITYRKRKIFYANGKIQELLPYFKKHNNKRVLVPVSTIHKKEIPNFLKKNNIPFEKVVLYKTVASDLSDLPINEFDIILFFSPSGIKSLQKNFPDYKQGDTYIGGFGPTVKKAIKNAGFRLDIAAPSQQAKSMVEALDQFLKSKMKEAKA